VARLSIEEIRALFADGSIMQEVGGQDGPVRPITREEGSGTPRVSLRLVMGKERISRRALTQESNGAVKEWSREILRPSGTCRSAGGKGIGAVAVESAQPTTDNVLAGRYTLVRPLLFVTKGAASPAAQSFVDFVLSPEGRDC